MRTIAERRSDPADDLVSTLIHSEVDGEALSDQEIVNESLLILIGGDETTRHRAQRRHGTATAPSGPAPGASRTIPMPFLGNGGDCVRWSSPIKNMARTLTRDTDFFGAQLKAG